MSLDTFFFEWYIFESGYPLGAQCLRPFLMRYGVNPDQCEEVDRTLFLDIMTPVRENIKLIMVEGRHTQVLFWVHVFLCSPMAIISIQRLPNTPFDRSVSVAATPSSIISCILALYRWVVRSEVPGPCWGDRMLVKSGRRG
jgi:hypothetical protein